MATYVVSPPPDAVLCGSSELLILAPDEVTALLTAKNADVDYVREQLEGTAQTALWKSGELEKKVMATRKPHVYYRLGKARARGSP
jgi:hypothetical protein